MPYQTGLSRWTDRKAVFVDHSHFLYLFLLIITAATSILIGGHAMGQSGRSTPWFINNALSTSLETPGAAQRIPLAETVEVRGKLFDVDGSPAAGAVVWAASLFAEPPLRERVLTDEQGNFTLHLKPLLGKSERWSISAYKGSGGAQIEGAQEWIDKPNPKQPKLITAKLANRETMQCRILDSKDRTPIEDARMYLDDGRVFVSSANGTIVIRGLKQSSHRTVVVAAGHERRRVIFDNTLRPDGKLNVYLDRAGRIEGTVVDQSGRAVPSAWIKISGSGSAMALDGRCAIANAKGEFVWDGVPFGKTVRSIGAGAEGYKSTALDQLTVHTDRPTRVVFRLSRDPEAVARPARGNTADKASQNAPGANAPNAESLSQRDLRGTVVGPDGKPVENALVRWGATLYEDVDREQRTNSSGEFKLSGVPDREGYATVIAAPFAPTFARVNKGQSNLEVKLSEGASIGGRVVDLSGDPVSGVHIVPVIASPDPSLCNPYWISERSTTSDNEGRFLIEGVPDAGVTFDFMHSEMSERRNQMLETGKLDHVVKLASRGGFRGRVVDTNGNPVKDFRVTIDFPKNRKPNEPLKGFSVVYRGIGVTYTDDQGRFAWGDEVAPGAPYRVTVWADGFGNTSIDRIVATSADRLRDSQEHLFTLPSPESLSVKVVDTRDTTPIVGAKVFLINGDPRMDEGRFLWGSDEMWKPFQVTDREGTTTFEQLGFDQATIAIQAPGYASRRFGWRQNVDGYLVSLVPESVVTGTIRSTSGTPLKGLSITLTGKNQSLRWAELHDDTNGQFRFDGLNSGNHSIEVRDERQRIFQSDVHVRAGQTFSLELKIDPKTRKVAAAKRTRKGKVIPDNIRSEVVAE